MKNEIKEYKITLSDKAGIIIRTVTKQSVLTAEAVYFQFCNFPSVIAGFNQVNIMEVVK